MILGASMGESASTNLLIVEQRGNYMFYFESATIAKREENTKTRFQQ